MGYRMLVGAILAAHFLFVAYVVVGGFVAWRWGWTIVAHLAAVGWGFLVVAFPWNCPLTAAEDWARQRAGQPALTEGFIDRYLTGVLYPERYVVPVRVLVALVVLVSWLGLLVRWRSARG